MISSISQKIELSDGHKMPGYGFGCYKLTENELPPALAAAWEVGYRLYDTAIYYHQEEAVGRAIKAWPAQDYFLISKIWPTDFYQASAVLDQSLSRLGREYLDAYLLHWPGTNEKLMLSAFEALLGQKEKGKIGTVGVSNFLERHLEIIRRAFGFFPALNQIESHPYFNRKSLTCYCREHKIVPMAWGPLGRGHALNDPVIVEIAHEVGKTPGETILRWQIQGGKVPIPKSAHPQRIRQNAEVFDFSLTPEQMTAIDGLTKPDGNTSYDPETFAG